MPPLQVSKIALAEHLRLLTGDIEFLQQMTSSISLAPSSRSRGTSQANIVERRKFIVPLL
jgi:hypothetical protein